MYIKEMMSNFWQAMEKSLKKITKGFVWFCMTFLIALMPVAGIWLGELVFHEKWVTFKELILEGDIFAISVVLISSLLWDYVIFENSKDEENFIVKSIFYGVPILIIPFNAVNYSFCQVGHPQQPELIELMMLFQIWILVITAIYAVLVKWNAFEQTHT
ncbi:MAG: hypothetical protein BWK78_08975 [Thiotrichaceae bacterium IS1]|nr:MAG: hypothetical protein BWK78_08975 [Thiotrichaceae bacterium IS1]